MEMNAKQMARYRAVSFRLAMLLRHKANKQQLAIDEAGWAKADAILSTRYMQDLDVTWSDLEQVRLHNGKVDKQRLEFKIVNGKKCIRAITGHSLDQIKVEKMHGRQATKQEVAGAQHGTLRIYAQSIRQHGLLKMGRNMIHLFLPVEQPQEIPKRSEVYFWVDTEAAIRDGHVFYKSSNNQILTKGPLGPEYLAGPKDSPYPKDARIPTDASLKHMEDTEDTSKKFRTNTRPGKKQDMNMLEGEKPISAEELKKWKYEERWQKRRREEEEMAKEKERICGTKEEREQWGDRKKRARKETQLTDVEEEISLHGYSEDSEEWSTAGKEYEEQQDQRREQRLKQKRSTKGGKTEQWDKVINTEQLLKQVLGVPSKKEAEEPVTKMENKENNNANRYKEITRTGGGANDEARERKLKQKKQHEQIVLRLKGIAIQSGGRTSIWGAKRHGAILEITGEELEDKEIERIINGCDRGILTKGGYIYTKRRWEEEMKRCSDQSIVGPTHEKKKASGSEIVLNQKAEGRFKGTVHKFCNEKKYGFITGENDNEKTGSDVFFHSAAFWEKMDRDDIREGAKVEFDLEKRSKGLPKAKQIIILRGGGATK